MADKKERKSTEPNAIQRFFRETIGELRKVNWPTREEALRLTGLVVIVLFIMAVFLGLVDYGAAYLLTLITGV